MDEEQPRLKVLRPNGAKGNNRKTKKLTLVFDPQARKEFLTGFHKRKLQRKKKAQEELQEQLKLERKRLKAEARESYKKLVVSHRPIPELEDLFTESYDLENHSVNIAELSTSDLAEKNYWIGPNKVQYEEQSKAVVPEEKKDLIPGMDLKNTRDLKKVLKKKATREVKKSKAFQIKNKLEQQKNKKKSMKQRKQNLKMHMKNKKKKQKHK